ncbi:MAG: MucR family transcriptional regulator [Rhodospirillales bacterium]|tara:strand:- start:1365 stop:1775 length:411 start_codon:yes stop_codon:yes gene_type:complete
MTEKPNASDLIELTTEIVAAHVGNNTIAPSDIPALINEVYTALSNVGTVPAQAQRPKPAVPPKKSVFPDYIVCLEDGKKLKMLKRHLKTAYNLTPEEYRERWGLPADYPMVAPSYAKHRSNLAKKIGLGTKPRRKR